MASPQDPAPRAGRSRDAARSRAAILDAAEDLFARHGFAGASIQAIADAAGVSKGTPIYFFGSKEALWAAVIDRLLERSKGVVARVGGLLAGGAADAPAVLEAGVDAYMDFLAANPNFMRLMGREALDRVGGASPAHAPPLAAAQGMLAAGPLGQALRPVDPLQLLVSVMALCAFPFAQADNLMKALGQDPYDPGFVAARKRHVLDLLLHGVMAR